MDSNIRRRVTSWVAQMFAALAVAVLVVVGVAYPAAAKGPSSARLVGPGIDPPIDLTEDSGSTLLDSMMRQTGLWFAASEVLSDEPAPADLGPRYTLSWVNSGPPALSEEERTIDQYIHAHAQFGFVIHTPQQDGLRDWGVSVIGWFVAPVGLEQTLTQLGIEIQSSPGPSKNVAGGDAAGAPSGQTPSGALEATLSSGRRGSASTQNSSSISAVHVSLIAIVAAAIVVAGTAGVRHARRPVSAGL